MRGGKKRRITNRMVRSLRTTGKDYIVFDTDLQGFGIRVLPSGRRIYVAQYRVPGAGRRSYPRRMSLGEAGTLSPDDARTLARKALGSVHHGKDPARDRASLKDAPLVCDIAPRFLDEMGRDLKQSTSYEYRRMFGYVRTKDGELKPSERPGLILPAIGRLRVRDVARADIARIREPNGGRYAANRRLALVSAFFSWCEQRGYRDSGTNPARGVKRHREEVRRRYLSPPEGKALGQALRLAEKEGASLYSTAAIRFLLFTGFREREALSLPWSAVDAVAGIVRLPEAKTAERERTLTVPALALLASLPRVQGNPYVFPGARVGDHLHEIGRVWNKVRRAANLENFRLHDLRHSFASTAISTGTTLAVVAELLGHRSIQTTKRYAHLFDDVRRAAAEKTTEVLAEWLKESEQRPTPMLSIA
jgi:integrase